MICPKCKTDIGRVKFAGLDLTRCGKKTVIDCPSCGCKLVCYEYGSGRQCARHVNNVHSGVAANVLSSVSSVVALSKQDHCSDRRCDRCGSNLSKIKDFNEVGDLCICLNIECSKYRQPQQFIVKHVREKEDVGEFRYSF